MLPDPGQAARAHNVASVLQGLRGQQCPVLLDTAGPPQDQAQHCQRVLQGNAMLSTASKVDRTDQPVFFRFKLGKHK